LLPVMDLESRVWKCGGPRAGGGPPPLGHAKSLPGHNRSRDARIRRVSDWTVTAASAATALGTLVLAFATFSSVRAGQRAARATEAALLAGIRPLLVASGLEDSVQKVSFQDDHFVRVGGGRAVVEVTKDVIYLVVSVRNVGNGLAVLDRWRLVPDRVRDELSQEDLEGYRRLTRDIYVPSGDIGFWQGALREPADPLFQSVREAATRRQPMTVDILYGDHTGGQRAVSRFSLLPVQDDQWIAIVGRHWNIDGGPER
jgi:hypothetical protein